MSSRRFFKPSLHTNCTFLYKLLLFLRLVSFSVYDTKPAPSLSNASEFIETTCHSKQCNLSAIRLCSLSCLVPLEPYNFHLRNTLSTLWARKRRFQRREKKNFLHMILPTLKHKLQKMYYSGLPLTESCNDHIVLFENRSFVSPAKKLRHGTGETKDVRLRGRGTTSLIDAALKAQDLKLVKIKRFCSSA
jgi:hypothetical protein